MSHVRSTVLKEVLRQQRRDSIGGGSLENDANLDNALMRFEFLEVIVRVALAKFPKLAAADAVTTLLTQHFLKYCGPDVAHDRNAFRRERLYNELIDGILKLHLVSLKAMFQAFCPTRPGTQQRLRRMPCRSGKRGWEGLLAKAKLFSIKAFTIRHARLAFTWSRMRIADELIDQAKTTSLSLTDFLEAIVRVADMVWLPSDEDLRAANLPVGSANAYRWEEVYGLTKPRDAADVTLLLHEKVSRLVNIMVHRLNKEGVRIPLY